MHPDEQKRIGREFPRVVTMGPDRVLAVSDLIQGQAQQAPRLTAMCKFGRSMQVRRLKTIGTGRWNAGDWKAAESILVEVESLMKGAEHPAQALGLAVLGVEVEALDEALAMLAEGESANTDSATDESATDESAVEGSETGERELETVGEGETLREERPQSDRGQAGVVAAATQRSRASSGERMGSTVMVTRALPGGRPESIASSICRSARNCAEIAVRAGSHDSPERS